MISRESITELDDARERENLRKVEAAPNANALRDILYVFFISL